MGKYTHTHKHTHTCTHTQYIHLLKTRIARTTGVGPGPMVAGLERLHVDLIGRLFTEGNLLAVNTPLSHRARCSTAPEPSTGCGRVFSFLRGENSVYVVYVCVCVRGVCVCVTSAFYSLNENGHPSSFTVFPSAFTL